MTEFQTDVLRPEDVLVVTATEPLSMAEMDRVREGLTASGVKFILVAHGALAVSVQHEPSDAGGA